MRLGPVTLDDQLVVSVGLHVQVSLTRVADHFHCQLVLDTVIEQDAAVERPDLGALVADDRTLEAELFHPWNRARKGTARARDHCHPG